MRTPLRRFVALCLLPGFLLSASCAPELHREIRSAAEIRQSTGKKSPYLNAHMKDGSFVALVGWQVNEAAGTVSGTGRRYDVDRRMAGQGEMAIPIDSVAVFEAASAEGMPPGMRALTIVLVTAAAIVGVVFIAFAIACASDPKCFGSCPTFYVSDGEKPTLQAEGFSASVAPALEATDIDALYRARPPRRDVDVTMTNEALETHVVRSLRLLAAPRPEHGRVFAAIDGRFWQASDPIAPRRATGPEGDCLPALLAFDSIERTSAVDSTDLAVRETIDLEFAAAAPGERLGLVVASRQTLLTTYLFYETLAAMGGSAGRWIAAMDRGDSTVRRRAGALGGPLGDVQVLVRDSTGAWTSAGEYAETGPIATDVRVVPLPSMPAGPVVVRVRATRGLYRFDWLALTRLGRAVEPVRLEPVAARRDSVDDPAALRALRERNEPLTTGPGDRYTFTYRLPGEPSRYELFLESRGYYLEWMRERWVSSEDPMRLARMMLSPRQALRDLAPAYAREQAALDDWFWKSRYARP